MANQKCYCWTCIKTQLYMALGTWFLSRCFRYIAARNTDDSKLFAVIFTETESTMNMYIKRAEINHKVSNNVAAETTSSN